METEYNVLGFFGSDYSCVRTIVVWKLLSMEEKTVRNACCVRTIVVWKPRVRADEADFSV